MLEIHDLHAKVADTEVLKGLNLNVGSGEIHAIMGPNGSGKSSLSKVIAGHPEYEVTSGRINYEVNFRNKDLLELSAEDRSREGIFLAFQYPIEIPGVPNLEFLRASFNALCKHQGIAEMSEEKFEQFVREKAAALEIDESFLQRELNVDLSGGEKKRNEILQMAVLSPRVAILDETDSGLDVDSLKIVSEGVNRIQKENNMSVILITHYDRILSYIKPDFVHILHDGRIIHSGDASLAKEIENRGYDWLIKEQD
ncbi:MAG: Fe-S cluster assembly ATPase SufC [Oligoflexus sp.]